MSLGNSQTSLGNPQSFEAGSSPVGIGGVLSNAPAALYPELSGPAQPWDATPGAESWAEARKSSGVASAEPVNIGSLEPPRLNLYLPTHIDHDGAVVSAASVRVEAQASGYVKGLRSDLPIDPITTPEATAILRVAGWPEEWIADILTIGACESSGGRRNEDGPLFHPGEAGDSGNSLGWLQLWSGWFAAAGEDVERWFDPNVNARVGLYVRTVRGKFGGAGGWSCAGLNGIY